MRGNETGVFGVGDGCRGGYRNATVIAISHLGDLGINGSGLFTEFMSGQWRTNSELKFSRAPNRFI